MKMRRHAPWVLSVVLAVALASCGNGSSDGPEVTEPSDEPTVATPAPTSPPPTEQSQDDAPSFEDTSWSVTHYASVSLNSITNVWEGTEITIEFGSDGTVSGNAGCNDFMGTYQVSGPYIAEPGLGEERGQAMTIADLSWTEIACESENLMEQEMEFLEVLPRVEYWAIGSGFSSSDESLLLRSLDDGLLVEGIQPG